jgi:hypothetical protein
MQRGTTRTGRQGAVGCALRLSFSPSIFIFIITNYCPPVTDDHELPTTITDTRRGCERAQGGGKVRPLHFLSLSLSCSITNYCTLARPRPNMHYEQQARPTPTRTNDGGRSRRESKGSSEVRPSVSVLLVPLFLSFVLCFHYHWPPPPSHGRP